ELSERAFSEGVAQTGLRAIGAGSLTLIALDTGDAERNSLLELHFASTEGASSTTATAAALIMDTPRLYQQERRRRALEHDIKRTAAALEVLAVVNAQPRFASAAM